jgi:Family of unknown function (DUF6152)
MIRKAIAVAGAILMLGAVVLAHHSAAQYSREIMTTRGTVEQYIWRNPHVTLIWNVKGANGETRQWVGELASVTSMIADGMTKDSLKPGQEVEVIACPSMIPGSHEAWIRTIKTAAGKVVVDAGRGACTPISGGTK